MVCSVSPKLFFLVLVHSKPDNFQHRQIIRDTWGSVSQIEGRRIKVLFLIGKFPSTDLTVQSGNTSKINISHEETIQEPKAMNFEDRITFYNRFYGPKSLKGYRYSTFKSNMKRKFSNRFGKERTILHEGVSKNDPNLKGYNHFSHHQQESGQQDYNALQEKIIEEHLRFDDIIQGNFIDNQQSSINKHLSGYKV